MRVVFDTRRLSTSIPMVPSQSTHREGKTTRVRRMRSCFMQSPMQTQRASPACMLTQTQSVECDVAASASSPLGRTARAASSLSPGTSERLAPSGQRRLRAIATWAHPCLAAVPWQQLDALPAILGNRRWRDRMIRAHDACDWISSSRAGETPCREKRIWNRPCRQAPPAPSSPRASADFVPVVHLRVVEGLHDDPVVHVGDAWRIRSRAFGGSRCSQVPTVPVNVAVSPATVTVR